MGLYSDAKAIAERDPAGMSVAQVIFLYSGFHALVSHRLAHWFYKHRRYFIARAISQLTRFLTGIEIHPGAKIGSGLFIDHGMGIVIGETAEIGNNCTIYHGVTLGGTGKDRGKRRHPIIADNVLIGAGAKVLGPFRVGDCAMIGANSVVLHEVPPDSTVVGVPGRVVRQADRHIRHNIELDHANSPDPVDQEICRLLQRVAVIENMMNISSQHQPGRKFKKNCPEDKIPSGQTAHTEPEAQDSQEIPKHSGGSEQNENL